MNNANASLIMTDPELDLLIIKDWGGIVSVTDIGVDHLTRFRARKTYNVIQMLGDTDIIKVEKGTGEYDTFEDAKDAAIEYLEDLISLCEDRLEEIRDVDSPEEYFGDDVAETLPSKSEGNVRYICAGHYEPDPEIQSKPIEWFARKVVKLRFPIAGRPSNGEYMWVAVDSIRGDEIVGTLTNEPHHADLHFGDEVAFSPEDVLVVHGYESVNS